MRGAVAAAIISGKDAAKQVYIELKGRVSAVEARRGRPPTLAVVLVGENPASKVYVGSKTKRAHKLGINTVDRGLAADISDAELQGELRALSGRPDIDGILLQLPLPKGLDEFAALMSIAPEKDVDGLHPFNQGLLMRGQETLVPCTPKGCMELIRVGRELTGHGRDLSGLNAVVLGRSILVGKPAASLLLHANCTVTQCHSRSRDLPDVCAAADVLIAAVGKPKLVGRKWIKPGAVVIDVGINRLEDGSLAGDVDFEEASAIAGAITPVPGGVGPMTIAMLMSNTVLAAERAPEA